MKDLMTGKDAVARPLAPQADLPPGPTSRCSACGTRLRTGQPHTGMKPYPHAVYTMLIVEEAA